MAVDGLNDILAEKIGPEVTSPMIAAKGGADVGNSSGIGRVGFFTSSTRLADLALKIKNIIGLSSIRYVGNPDSIIRTAALCTGSGGSLVREFIKTGTDLYISGDIKYHEARDVEVMGRAVIDTGHFGSEIIMIEAMADRLRNFFASSGNEIKITEIRCEKEPFVFL
jgi:putative NIF3 family GTP cyclohydrolase 1 type 2